MTLLSIADNVAYETKGENPATIAGNTTPGATQLLRLINKVGTRLMRLYDWKILETESTFTASGNEIMVTAANMPSDFDRFIPETFWDRDSENLVTGPISPVEWGGLKARTYTDINNIKFIHRGGAISALPVVGVGVNLAFEYISNEWCTDTTGVTGKTAMGVDTDVSLIDEELITAIVKYEWLKDEGQPYIDAGREAKAALDLITSNDASVSGVAVVADIFATNSRHFDGTPKASGTSNSGYF